MMRVFGRRAEDEVGEHECCGKRYGQAEVLDS
jgi:hypothetical protein